MALFGTASGRPSSQLKALALGHDISLKTRRPQALGLVKPLDSDRNISTMLPMKVTPEMLH
jgi:hypothetical protein